MTVVEDLKKWALTFHGQGRHEEAKLLERAADLIAKEQRDPAIALEMAAWQAVVSGSPYQTFVDLLGQASDQLRN